MSKAEVPITYIIAIILGIIVLAILGYLIITSGGDVIGTIKLESCRAKLLGYCTSWSSTGYTKKPENKGFYDINKDCDAYIEKLTEKNDDASITKKCKEILNQK